MRLRDLVHPVLRRPHTVGPLAAALVPAAAVAWTSAVVSDDPSVVLLWFRVAAALVAAMAASAAVDGAEELTTAAPVGRPRLRALSLAVASMMVGAVWTVLLVGTRTLAADGRVLAARGLALESLALTLLGWAAASSLAKRFEASSAGAGASLGVLGVAYISLAWPRGVELLWPSPDTRSDWAAAHVRWTVIGALALVWLVTANQDPATRRRFTRWVPRPQTAG